MSITKREKELIGVGVSVAAGCKPCTDHHLKSANDAGASKDRISQAIRLGAAVRKQAAEVMEAFALGEPPTDRPKGPPSTRLDLLISIAAAYAVNSTDELVRYLEQAETAEIAEIDIKSAAKLAGFIRGKAISHVEKLVELESAEEEKPQEEPKSPPPWAGMMKGAGTGCGCGDSDATHVKED